MYRRVSLWTKNYSTFIFSLRMKRNHSNWHSQLFNILFFKNNFFLFFWMMMTGEIMGRICWKNLQRVMVRYWRNLIGEKLMPWDCVWFSHAACSLRTIPKSLWTLEINQHCSCTHCLTTDHVYAPWMDRKRKNMGFVTHCSSFTSHVLES